MDASESNGKAIGRHPAGSSAAVSKSHTTAAVCFRPRCQLGSRASRKTRLSGWNPAALRTARATFRNSGQREATPTNEPDGAGKYPASEAGTERTCSVISSVPAGSNCRAVASRFGSTTGIPPSGALGQSCGAHDSTGKVTARRDLGGQDAPQFFVGLNQQKMVGRLQLQPLSQAHAQHGQSYPQLARRAEQARNHLIERQSWRGRDLGFPGANVHAAATAKLHPAIALELAVSGADRVGMQVKAPRQIARARQALTGRQIVAQYAEDDLGDQLFADGDFAAAGKPELHGGNIIARAKPRSSRVSLRPARR